MRTSRAVALLPLLLALVAAKDDAMEEATVMLDAMELGIGGQERALEMESVMPDDEDEMPDSIAMDSEDDSLLAELASATTTSASTATGTPSTLSPTTSRTTATETSETSLSTGTVGAEATQVTTTTPTQTTTTTKATTMSTTTTMTTLTTMTTTTTTTGIVEGTVHFEVTGGSAPDLVTAFNSDSTGEVAQALSNSIAAGIDGVAADDVTITGVELTTERRLLLAFLQSGRRLTTSTVGVVVRYEIAVASRSGMTSDEVVAALSSSEAVAAIEDSLSAELQQVDPSLTIAALEVEAVVVTRTTTTAHGTTEQEQEVVFLDSSAFATTWHSSLALAGCIAWLRTL
mmetsp:Transcript_11863/g.21678  ORF Transcript_11863/g.21678 Transcript_11863/m.21678 type:complete len:345 (+) Transcript_11863:47-1081(+)